MQQLFTVKKWLESTEERIQQLHSVRKDKTATKQQQCQCNNLLTSQCENHNHNHKHNNQQRVLVLGNGMGYNLCCLVCLLLHIWQK